MYEPGRLCSFGKPIAVITLICSLAGARTVHQDTASASLLSDYQIVDQVTARLDSGKLSHDVLAIDKDDEIMTFSWIEQGSTNVTSPRVTGYFGQRVRSSGSLPLEGLLPRGQVPFVASRYTVGPDMRIHVVITRGFEEKRLSPEVWYSLFVFAENLRTRTVRMTYQEKDINRELEKFLVRDINGDGLMEIFDFGRAGKIGDAIIRRVSRDGKVALLQHLEGYRVNLIGDTLPELGYKLVVEDEVGHVDSRGETCFVRREFHWSQKENKFVRAR
jgi:hypothetical protein